MDRAAHDDTALMGGTTTTLTRRAGKMARAQRTKKIKAATIAAANDPTPERMRRDAWTDVDPRTLPDGSMMARSVEKPRKRVDPIRRMEAGRDPWLDRPKAHALEIYGRLIEQSGYDAGSRGCLSTSHGGGGAENLYDLKTEARRRLARAANAVAAEDQVALLFVNAVLSPAVEKTVGELAGELLHGGLGEARTRVVTAADALLGHFTGSQIRA